MMMNPTLSPNDDGLKSSFDGLSMTDQRRFIQSNLLYQPQRQPPLQLAIPSTSPLFVSPMTAPGVVHNNMFGQSSYSPASQSAPPQPWLNNPLLMNYPTQSSPLNQLSVNNFFPNPYMQSPTLPNGANGNVNGSSRTVYVGNLPPEASVDELLNLVRFGPIESVKILPEKSCAFISFLDSQLASAFHADILMRKVQLHGQDLKIGWGKVQPVSSQVVNAVQQNGATRNVYLGNLDESITEQDLRDDLARFGPIDQVKIVRDQGIGFVHFLSISTAMKVVNNLPQEVNWTNRKVNYGKDRCAYVPKNQHQQQQHNLAAAAMAANFTGALSSPLMGMGPMNGMGLMDPNMGNRTVYLGNLHPDTTIEEICNAIRGGILQQIRYISEKHISFVTFVDPNAALAFLATSVTNGVTIHQRRIKIGWGKHSGPPPPAIALVVQAGGSRNIYIGNLTDFEEFDEARIKKDFGQFGEIELVNLLKEKNCAFVNFTQISFAIKALEGMKQNADYSSFKIAYGKDRCGNAPRGGFGLIQNSYPTAAALHNMNGHMNSPDDEALVEGLEDPNDGLEAPQ